MPIRIYIAVTQFFVAALLLILHLFSAYFSFFYLENIFFKKIISIEANGYEPIFIIPILAIVEVLKHLFTFLFIEFGKRKSIIYYSIIFLSFSVLFYVGSFVMAVKGSEKKILKQEENKSVAMSGDILLQKEKLEKQHQANLSVLQGRLSLADTLRTQRFKVGYSLTEQELELIKRDEEKIEQSKKEYQAKLEEIDSKEKILIEQNQFVTGNNIEDIFPFSVGIEILILLFTILVYILPKDLKTKETVGEEDIIQIPVEEQTELIAEVEEVSLESDNTEELLVEDVIVVPIQKKRTAKNLSKTENGYKTSNKYAGVRKALEEGKSIRAIETETGISRTTIAKIKKTMESSIKK